MILDHHGKEIRQAPSVIRETVIRDTLQRLEGNTIAVRFADQFVELYDADNRRINCFVSKEKIGMMLRCRIPVRFRSAPMADERAYLEAMGRRQGGFTVAQWDRLVEIENQRMAPVIEECYRRMEMHWFRANERHLLFREAAD